MQTVNGYTYFSSRFFFAKKSSPGKVRDCFLLFSFRYTPAAFSRICSSVVQLWLGT